MDALRIYLFGPLRVAYAGESSPISMPPSVRTLLAFLLLQPSRVHPRDVLAAVCWGERPNDHARACLNTALWRLRRVLGPASSGEGNYLLTTPTGEVGFNWHSDHWIDLEIFESSTRRFLLQPPETLTPASVQDLEAVLPLYCGDLLEGFYADWALQERERLRLVYLDCLARLMRYHARVNAYEPSLHFGHVILRHDPLREEIHRELMQLHWRMGERDRAVRQYQMCREVLASELGIPPMPETEALYAQIVAGTEGGGVSKRPPRTSCGVLEAPGNLEEALQHLAQATETLDAARRDVVRAATLVRSFRRDRGSDLPGAGAVKAA